MTHPFEAGNGPQPTRRTVLAAGGRALSAVMAAPAYALSASTAEPKWVCTTRGTPWQYREVPAPSTLRALPNIWVRADRPQQTVKGFGAAFSELSWDALQMLPAHRRTEALDLLFLPGHGLDLDLGRTPIGASDFARDWYSYDETPGDFELSHFSVQRDNKGLIPFIRAARRRRPDLELWASPWSPPSWMKTNGYYAMAKPRLGQPDNGIRPDQVGVEGQDYFIQEPRYLAAYARYFRRYVEEYRKAGLPIAIVMPQNEFNSAQPFPSCCWTPEGLARFIPYLGREMDQVGVDIFLGTLERPDVHLFGRVLSSAEAKRYVKGVGVQWAGKGALPGLRLEYPAIPVWGTEQECGDGKNDWRYARYCWSLMRRYFEEGASAYMYWNIALPTASTSSWGWSQNSLITVDSATQSYRLNPEFYVLRHLSGFVRSGACRLPAISYEGYDNALAFQNPNGEIIIAVQNDLADPLPVSIGFQSSLLNVVLPADSLNTFTLPPTS